MCGIFGVVYKKPDKENIEEIEKLVEKLFMLSESRGKEASGLAVRHENEIRILKEPVRSKEFVSGNQYCALFENLKKSLIRKESINSKTIAIIGHSRLMTSGSVEVNYNNQPVITQNIVGIHNGIIVNHSDIWRKIIKKNPPGELDSQALFALIDKYRNSKLSTIESVRKAFGQIEGSASVAFIMNDEDLIVLSTNTGSLYCVTTPQAFVFASESHILQKALQRPSELITGELPTIEKINACFGRTVNLETLSTYKFSLISPKSENKRKVDAKHGKTTTIKNLSPNNFQNVLAERVNNSIGLLKKHVPNYKKIDGIKRCVKCILPSTTPFIEFDSFGVCNYCNEHVVIDNKGAKQLKDMVKKYRSKDGRPDCILAFSGGRDSSYGLHFLKKELGMNPVAFTYDWGMVTDLARRNQARMVGKLGVEHVIVSADIAKKRQHIRKNISAWLNRPDIGMVPLFMEGDKQCEYYVDRLRKRMGVKLVFFCRGNELEREEFKTGHCGVKDADPGGVIHHLSLGGKFRLAWYYAIRYLLNPSYINSSIVDVLLGYYFTYIKKHDYVYLWHYIPWSEEQIISTLKREYNWELSDETPATWRTDDGSPAFYNYIYLTVQGFTENDSFRSRQIREGVLSRKKALKLVNEENKIRYKALKWYFDNLDIDGDRVLSVVDKIPKLY